MALADRITRKARERVEAQLSPAETKLYSGTLGTPTAVWVLVVTTSRVILSPSVAGSAPDVTIPVGALHAVTWQKGVLGLRGTLTIVQSASSKTFSLKKDEGEAAASALNQALAGR